MLKTIRSKLIIKKDYLKNPNLLIGGGIANLGGNMAAFGFILPDLNAAAKILLNLNKVKASLIICEFKNLLVASTNF